MKRNHIHFAPGEPGNDQVISGSIISLPMSVWVLVQFAVCKHLLLALQLWILHSVMHGSVLPYF